MYHRVVPVLPERDPYHNCMTAATFEGQLKWLARRGYRSLRLADVEQLLPPGNAGIPPRTVVFTFDDGYEDNYRYAWPLLRRYGFTACIFLVADAVGGDNSFDSAHGYDLTTMLTLDQIKEMQRGGIEFGSHTCSHPDDLRTLTDRALQSELEDSRRVLEELLGMQVRHFAYPHTLLDARVEAAVESAGYQLACAGPDIRMSRFCLPRAAARSAAGPILELQLRRHQLKWMARDSRGYAGGGERIQCA